MSSYFLYILQCSDGSYYIGYTSDIEKRIAEHANGQGGFYTLNRLPVKLVYSEEFPSRKEAFLAEQKLKKWSREKKEIVIKSGWKSMQHWNSVKKIDTFLKTL